MPSEQRTIGLATEQSDQAERAPDGREHLRTSAGSPRPSTRAIWCRTRGCWPAAVLAERIDLAGLIDDRMHLARHGANCGAKAPDGDRRDARRWGQHRRCRCAAGRRGRIGARRRPELIDPTTPVRDRRVRSRRTPQEVMLVPGVGRAASNYRAAVVSANRTGCPEHAYRGSPLPRRLPRQPRGAVAATDHSHGAVGQTARSAVPRGSQLLDVRRQLLGRGRQMPCGARTGGDDDLPRSHRAVIGPSHVPVGPTGQCGDRPRRRASHRRPSPDWPAPMRGT